MGGMDVLSAFRLSQNATKAVCKKIVDNNIDQNKQDKESGEITAKKNQETRSAEKNYVENNLEGPMTSQNTDILSDAKNILSDPKEDAMRRFFILNDLPKA